MLPYYGLKMILRSIELTPETKPNGKMASNYLLCRSSLKAD
ncbi:hypothetical protein GM3709_3828 (plasmid) [Geminocystis sp. NIES-3709]|nr:hypothetical protein GM3709_3828 [Geminocystis sp. NIES-3709]